MTEPKIEAPGLEQDDTLFQAGAQSQFESDMEKLEEMGLNPDELFGDGADIYRPRRGKRRGSRRHRTYDPAPKRKTTARRTGKKRGILSKLKPFVLPASAGITMYGAYTARATELFNAGLITSNDVISAIMYDVQNLDTNAAFTRLTSSDGLTQIGVPAVGGYVIKEMVGGTTGRVLADALYGYAAGTAANLAINPSSAVAAIAARRAGIVARPARQIQAGAVQAMQLQPSACGQRSQMMTGARRAVQALRTV